MRPPPPPAADPFARRLLEADWRRLCALGERRAGSEGERRAAERIAEGFAAAGADEVRIESFPCAHLRGAVTEVHERHGRGWRRIEAAALVGAPSTPGGRAVTGDVAWLELPEQGDRLAPGSLRGRFAAVFGPLPTEIDLHRRLVAADPLAVIHVDDRLPFPWTKNDGIYPYWAKRYGVRPTLTVPYTDAWRWRRDGVRALRVKLATDVAAGESQNVVAEWRGRDAERPALLLGAHHDTQCGNPGADDNASGVVVLLALARALAGRRRRRPLRLVSFGGEEQLSVGSAAYVARHAPGPADLGLMINFDSVSSPLGHWQLLLAGAPALARHARAALARGGLDVAVQTELTPFSDHFPFNRAGIPSLWFMRTNFPGGRWQHHSPHDTLEHVSAERVQQLLRAAHPLIEELAQAASWPFPGRLGARQLAAARRIGRELFG